MKRVPPVRIVQVVAACDVFTGMVLTVLGLVGGVEVLTIIGAVLLVSGAGVSAFLVWQRNRPEPL